MSSVVLGWVGGGGCRCARLSQVQQARCIHEFRCTCAIVWGWYLNECVVCEFVGDCVKFGHI